MLSAILFDLDGTLANTDPIHYKVWQEILAEYGIKCDREFLKELLRSSLKTTYYRLPVNQYSNNKSSIVDDKTLEKMAATYKTEDVCPINESSYCSACDGS